MHAADSLSRTLCRAVTHRTLIRHSRSEPFTVGQYRWLTGGAGASAVSESARQLQQYLDELQRSCNEPTNMSATGSCQETVPRRHVALRLLVDLNGPPTLQAAFVPTSSPLASDDQPLWVTVPSDDESCGGCAANQSDARRKVPQVTMPSLPQSDLERNRFAGRVTKILLSRCLVEVQPPPKETPITCAAHRPMTGEHDTPAPRRTDPSLPRTSVVDLTAVHHDDLTQARKLLENLYPRLRLHIEHTSGLDLQASRTHTFTVRLRPRLQGVSLSEPERQAVMQFTSETIGSRYFGTLRRALKDAFRGVGIDFPPPHTDSDSSHAVSVLSLYHSILTKNSVVLDVEMDRLSVSVRATAQGTSHALYSVTGKARNSLSLILSASEAVAEKVDKDAACAVRQKVANASLVVVLPEKGVRVKRVLRRLLNYYYGIDEEHVAFDVTSPSPGVFLCNVIAPVPFVRDNITCEETVGTNALVSAPSKSTKSTIGKQRCQTCVLGSATSTSKKIAMRLAAVAVLREHFPSVFVEQLEYHPEMQQLLNGETAAQECACPHVSKGLRAVLDWALQQENAATERQASSANEEVPLWLSQGEEAFFARNETTASPPTISTAKLTLLSRRLAGGDYDTETSRRASATAWVTDLTITAAQNDRDGAAKPPLRILAFDQKKGRSEQKALAAALAQRYVHSCQDAVSYAVHQGLITSTGEPTPCSALIRVPPSDQAGAHQGFLKTDPIIAALRPTPRQAFPLPPIKDAAILATLRRRTTEVIRLQAQQSSPNPEAAAGMVALVEEVTERRDRPLSGDVVHVARLLAVRGADTSSGTATTELSRATHRYKLCALLAAYRRFLFVNAAAPFQASNDERSDDHSAPREDACTSEMSVFSPLADSLPTETPVECVLTSLRDLYGTTPELHTYADRNRTTVELWGRVDLLSSVPSAVKEKTTQPKSDSNENYCFLAKGRGSTMQDAVVNCAFNAFEAHIRPLKGLFPGRRLRQVSFPLRPTSESLLGALTSAVVTEIQATNDDGAAACSAEIRAHYHEESMLNVRPTPSVDLVFSGVTQAKHVELERVNRTTVFAAVYELCNCIAKETNLPFSPAALPGPEVTPFRQLQHLCKLMLGCEPTIDSVFARGEWHCRVSIPVGGSRPVDSNSSTDRAEEVPYYWCLGTASAHTKKEAMEEVARYVLGAQFPPEIVERLPAHIAVPMSVGAEVGQGEKANQSECFVYTLT